jgi:hypothetical protein
VLPVDGQGNHILVGKNDTDNTSIKHSYIDEKPVLLVARTKDQDVQTIRLRVNTITIKTTGAGNDQDADASSGGSGDAGGA